MTDDLSVALVSNRGPVSFKATDGGFDKQRGAGGLAGALDPVARGLGDRAVWICAATSDGDRRALAAGAAEDLPDLLGYRVQMLDIPPDTYARYYDIVSNRMLWFANHCLWDELNIHEFGDKEISAWKDAYEPVNELFARTTAEFADPSSVVLFQDYHLASAPHYLRKMHPDQVIFHFTHSSFCGPDDGLERLPRPIPQQIIEGMLGADLVGFHVPHWCENFLRCCEKVGATVDRGKGLVEHDGRRSWVRPYPIPVDPTQLRERAEKEKAQKWAEEFATWGAGARLIVRADRAEPSKNIIRGFEAFGHLLDQRPDLRGEVRFVACLYPSRQSMPEYQRYTDAVDRVVAEVNDRHPDAVRLFMKDDFDRTLGALQVYDVLLVNPIMDGMNLVSKEGPTLNQKDGVLVLSSGAGSFDELKEGAVHIDDPMDIEQTAAAMLRALEMDDDERSRLSEAVKRLAVARRPEDWIGSQLEDLVEIRAGRPPKTPVA
jgi:trehalose 6-phosphate synthase